MLKNITLATNEYKITETLNIGRNFSVYRAIRVYDQQKFILKTCRLEQPTTRDLAILRHEYEILKKFNSPYIIAAYDLIHYHHNLVLILEDTSSQSLRQYLNGLPINLDMFFTIALHLADALNTIHAHDIIHKNITPDNIIFNLETVETKLIDFGISTLLTEEVQDLIQVDNLAGTLPYISPEQTGRMNRTLDYRTDFYSLGVTFYEMLTGQLPFSADDPLELIYDHLAKTPPSVDTIIPEIPATISLIIDKLMNKLPEDRYVSAAGLKADLLTCQDQWKKRHKINHFLLGKSDIHDHLVISQKLYGRAHQVEQLLNSFNRVTEGNKEILLVSGYSGIGKTSLVKEIYRPITKQQGYFISGKYDQLQRTTPYNAIIEAFQELIRRILTEPEEKLNKLKQALKESLGNNGQIINNIIPQAELIIGEQPPVPELSPTHAQSRFMITFRNFIQTLAQPEHPIVIFLDDLQWADSSSLKLLELVIKDPDIRHLFIIGAYRDNEVTKDHLLTIFQQNSQNDNIAINQITIPPLTQEDIQCLLADTFCCRKSDTINFAKLLLDKTQGNPYFINVLLRTLYTDRMIAFCPKLHRWQWDLNRIDEAIVTDNVVDILNNQFRKLPTNTQQTLKIAACIGHTFNLDTLSIISKRSAAQLVQDLSPAIQANLIRPIEANNLLETKVSKKSKTELNNKIIYSFNHDRIQQAAYGLIKRPQHQKFHLMIGRLLIQSTPIHEHDERLFDILNHFNTALLLIDSEAEKHFIAKANLWAGTRAKASAAYQAAHTYFEAGISLLPTSAWDTDYEMCFSLHKELAECKYLIGYFKEAEMYLNDLHQKAQTFADTITIYKHQIINNLLQGKQNEAVEITIKIFKLFKLKVPYSYKFHRKKILLKIKWALRSRTIQDLYSRQTTDDKIKLFHEISKEIGTTLIASNPYLFYYYILTGTYLSILHGYYSMSSTFYLCFATLLLHTLGCYEKCFAFMELSLKVEEYPSKSLNCLLSGTFIFPWKYPLEKALEIFMQGYQYGLELGDVMFAHLNLNRYCMTQYDMGRPLSEINEALDKDITYKKKYRLNIRTEILDHLQKIIIPGFQGTISLDLPQIMDFLKSAEKVPNKTEISLIYSAYTKLLYMLGFSDQVRSIGKQREFYAQFNQGSLSKLSGDFYHALSLLACYPHAQKKEQNLILKKLKDFYNQFKQWAHWCSINFRAYERVLAAGIAHIQQNPVHAMDCYEEAIAAAEEIENFELMGIAYECAGRFYLDRHQSLVAKVYFTKAHYAYTRWGALAKTKLLEDQFPEWFNSPQQEHLISGPATLLSTLSPSTYPNAIDMMSILRFAQTISSEIQFDRLLEKLLRTLLQNAGAHRVMLLMSEGGSWVVKANGTESFQQIYLNQVEPIETRSDIPLTLISYVQRTQEKIIIQNSAELESYLAEDNYLLKEQPQSLLIIPILHQGRLHTLLYLEHSSINYAFSSTQIMTLELLASQIAVALENARLYYQATHDPLTGLANRTLLTQIFDQATKTKNKSNIAIFFFDLDGFKKINDTLGHQVGDNLLIYFADKLRSCIRKDDLAVRLGGDEFILLLKNDASDINQISGMAERILKLLTRPATINGHKIMVQTSIGISLYPQHGQEIQSLLKQADTALYQVKKSGKGHYLIWSPDLT